jgi:hypothetical protein
MDDPLADRTVMPARTWHAVVIVACLAAACVCTWPLVLQLGSAVPLGTESAATIPLFDVWTLWWGGQRLWHGFADLWNAPIFHPTAGTFAFSEPLLLPGLLAAPLFALHAPPALAHNLVLLVVLAGNGICACRLARALGVPRLPALLTGVLMVNLPFFAKLQGELPLLAIFGMLLALDGLVRFGAAGRTLQAITAGLGVLAQALCCQQLALFSLIFIAGAALIALGERRWDRRAAGQLCGVAAIVALVLAAIARVPLAVHAQLGFGRDVDLVQSLSAWPRDFLSRPAHALVGFPSREDTSAFTQGLFPGLLVLALAIWGAVAPSPQGRWRAWRWYCAGACGVGFLLALGLNLSIGGAQPIALLRRLPGFVEIRSVFRAAVFVQLHLVLLAGFGLSALARRLAGLRPSWSLPAVVAAVGLLAALENLSLPAPLLTVSGRGRDESNAFLARQPPGTVVAHVPFAAGGDVDQLAVEAWRMLDQIDHGQPLVNGYASHFPALHRELLFAMAGAFPDHTLACGLRRVFGADLLVVDQFWLADHRAGFAALATMLHQEYSDDATIIYRLQPSGEECPPMRADIGAPPQ